MEHGQWDRQRSDKMAVQCDGGGKDDLKTQFMTREGTYKLMTLCEYSRPHKLGCSTVSSAQSAAATGGGANSHTSPVKISFVTLPDPAGNGARICFNVGRELFLYMYKGLRKLQASDISKPIDKRVYKGTYPMCHDFNEATVASDSVSLLVGFSAGQIQLIDPIKKELSKLYNEERLIDKTRVTCVKWLPGSKNQFLVAHGSGQMYVYNEELPCGTTPPHYQVFKQGDGFCVYTCKTKSTRNPLYRWVVGDGSLNEFAFSPCCRYVATVSQDGFLRVFNYDTMDLLGVARSYFGGLLCVCWSPDGKYVVTGGEDDLVTVWSFPERRVVARGHGHKSWVSVVAFDPFTTLYGDPGLGLDLDFGGSDEELVHHHRLHRNALKGTAGKANGSATPTPSNRSARTTPSLNVTCYRFGSVGQDTQLCLWDLTEDVIRQPLGRSRTSVLLGHGVNLSALGAVSTGTGVVDGAVPQLSNSVGHRKRPEAAASSATGNCVAKDAADGVAVPPLANSAPTAGAAGVTHKFATLSLVSGGEKKDVKEHKRNFSLASRNSDKNSVLNRNHPAQKVTPDDPVRLVGTLACPRLDDVPILEPLVCKRITHERLTALVFQEDCIVTACQEGYILTWVRPGRVMITQPSSSGSPTSSAVTLGGMVV